MNNFFFTALCLVLLYYFFFYLPNQKTNANQPASKQTQTNLVFTNQAIQTEPETELIDPEPIEDEQITSLKEDLTNSRQANQKLLETVNLFQKNKELIKEAVEFHLNFASSFLTEHSNPELLDTKREVNDLSREVEEKIKELEETAKSDLQEGKSDDEATKQLKKEKVTLERRLDNLKNWLDPRNPTIKAFAKQKEKNQKIVEQCQELLKGLAEKED